MSHVRGQILIDRAVEEVFDFVADERKEPTYNPAMVGVQKLTQGPVGLGTRYAATVISRGRPVEMLIETTSFIRPLALSSTTSMAWAHICGTLTFEPVGGRTRMAWDWDVVPVGVAHLLGPVIGLVGRRQEAAIWTQLKQVLEHSRR